MPARPIDHSGADRAGLRNERHITRQRARWREESRVQREVRIEQPDAVGAEQAHVLLSCDPQAGLFQCCSLRSGFSKSARSDDDRFQSAPGAILQHSWDGLGRDEQDRKVERVGHIQDVRVDRLAKQASAARIDEMDCAFVIALDQVACQPVSKLGWIEGGADHRHARR